MLWACTVRSHLAYIHTFALARSRLREERSSYAVQHRMTCDNPWGSKQRRVLPPAVASLLFAFVSLTGNQAARADGIVAYQQSAGWQLAGELSQEAVVRWHDGQERIVLRVTLADSLARARAKALAWVLPLPVSTAEQIRVGVLRGWPTIEGVDVLAAASQRLREILVWAATSQLWPVLIAPISREAPPPFRAPPVAPVVLLDGIATHVLCERSRTEVKAGLDRIGVFLSSEALQGLDTYVDSRNCLVVYWVADLDAARRAARDFNALSVVVDFPSPQFGYFPLVASSTLPGGPIDIRLTIRGFVRATSDLPSLTTNYHVGAIRDPPATVGDAGSASPDERFTEFRIVAAPASLRHDLHFESARSPLPRWAAGWLGQSRVTAVAIGQGLLYLVVLATLASLLLRPLWPKPSRPSWRAMLLLGVAHAATVLGATAVALLLAHRLRTRRRAAFYFVGASSAIIAIVTILLEGLARWVLQ